MGSEARALPPALREVLAEYAGLDVEPDAGSATPLGTGLLHQSWAVRAAGRDWVVQRVNGVFAPAIHDNIDAVSRHLADRGRSTITLRPTRRGTLFVERAGGERWRLMERLPGVTFETCAHPSQAQSAGAAAADFHSALADFDRPLAPMGFRFHDTPHELEALRGALVDHADHPRARDVAALAEKIFAAGVECRPPSGLPLRVVHGDLKFSNVLFAGEVEPASNEAVALIDLDTVCRLPIYFDMGDAWRSWSNRRAEDVPEAELDVAIFNAGVEGYLSQLEIRLDRTERASLERGLENVTLELCARFATDVLRESWFAWDPSRFESSAEHNWARARGQWSLYEQARETATERLSALRRGADAY